MLSAISVDEYKQNKQTVELDSASRTILKQRIWKLMQKILRKSPEAYQRKV